MENRIAHRNRLAFKASERLKITGWAPQTTWIVRQTMEIVIDRLCHGRIACVHQGLSTRHFLFSLLHTSLESPQKSSKQKTLWSLIFLHFVLEPNRLRLRLHNNLPKLILIWPLFERNEFFQITADYSGWSRISDSTAFRHNSWFTVCIATRWNKFDEHAACTANKSANSSTTKTSNWSQSAGCERGRS